jgi:UDP-glucose 6-dehydrogenase
MKIGIIGLGNLGLNLLRCFAEQQHEIYVSDVDGDNYEVIKNSDVIFCCVNTEILPSNIYDIKNVMDVVEDFGVAFEEEVPLVDKIVVLCSTMNPGDTKDISDILTPMNLRVCYLPLTLSSDNYTDSLQSQEKIIVGSIDPYTVNIVGTLISDFQKKTNNHCFNDQ